MSLAGKNVALFCDFKFEDMEVMYPKVRLEEEGATVTVVGVHKAGIKYTGKFGYPIKSDLCISAFDSTKFDALILPGGFAPDYMRRSKEMLAATVEMFEAGKPIAAICHGPWMMCSARLTNGDPIVKGRRATAFCAIKDDLINAGAEYSTDSVVVDGNLITAQTPADLTPWCRAIINGIVANSAPAAASKETSHVSAAFLSAAETTELASWGQRVGCDTGAEDCKASGAKLEAEGGVSVGVWECTTGGFPVACRPTTETCVILSGSANITTTATGATRTVKAGDVFVLPKGWVGRWDILSTLRKVYIVH